MARINFEDDVESKRQFWGLLKAVGDRDAALGKLVRFFRLAQKHFGQESPIPKEELDAEGLGCMIESGWAVPVSGGYRALGAEEHFAWYRQKVEAGKKGGRPKQAENDNRPVISANRDKAPVNPPAPAPALSPALVKNQDTKGDGAMRQTELALELATATPSAASAALQKVRALGKDRGSGEGTAVAFLIGVYIRAWQGRWGAGARPDVGGKARGILLRLVRDHKPEHLADLLQVYCQMRDPWFETKKHDLVTFEGNYNKVALAFTSGSSSGTNWDFVTGSDEWRKNGTEYLPSAN